MKITILAYGSRGDVQPYVALGEALQNNGHHVRLAAPARFSDFVRDHGLDFHPLPGEPANLVSSAVQEAGTSFLRAIPVVLRHAMEVAAEVVVSVRQACRGCDMIVHSFLMTSAGHMVALEMAVPELSAMVLPLFAISGSVPNPGFPALPFGAAYNRLTHHLFNAIYWSGGGMAYRWIRRRNPDLPAMGKWPFRARRDQQPVPILYGLSPTVLPPPADWPAWAHMTGYWFLNEDAGPVLDERLASFLDHGEPPIFVGFSSVISEQARALTAMTVEALQMCGKRGILQSGWGGLEGITDSDHVVAIGEVSYSRLFPRMAALVHHGGVGTTAEGLRAGVPALVVPFTADQPFWGRQVARLGAGPKPIPHKRLTADALARAIQTMTGNTDMHSKARELSSRIQAEDGASRAVALIEEVAARVD